MIYTVTLNPALDKTVEAPGFALDAVNRIGAARTDPGGKGINVSKGIARLGGRCVTAALLAGPTGRTLAARLEAMGMDTLFAFGGEGETRTNLKVVDPVGHTTTDLNEPGPAVRPEVLDGLLDKLTGRLRPGDLVVLAGSLPPGAPADTYRTWTGACRQAGAKVFLDADRQALAAGIEARPYLIKPNEHELSALLGRELSGAGELRAAAGELLAAGVEKVVVSMGGRGALYVTREGAIQADGLPVKVASTVGAGDSMVAALAWAEEQGLPWEEAVVLSTAAGAASAMCSGTQAAGWEAIRTLMPQVVWRRL